MRTSLLRLLGLTLAAALAASSCGDDPAEPDGDDGDPTTATVSMPGFSFTPFNTTIAVGGTVTFDFPAEPHNVIFNRVTGAPADIQQTRNARVTRTFQVAGRFPFDCTLHPGMSGEVVAR